MFARNSSLHLGVLQFRLSKIYICKVTCNFWWIISTRTIAYSSTRVAFQNTPSWRSKWLWVADLFGTKFSKHFLSLFLSYFLKLILISLTEILKESRCKNTCASLCGVVPVIRKTSWAYIFWSDHFQANISIRACFGGRLLEGFCLFPTPVIVT